MISMHELYSLFTLSDVMNILQYLRNIPPDWIITIIFIYHLMTNKTVLRVP